MVSGLSAQPVRAQTCLATKNDAAQLLRRPAVAPPETTVFAVIGMVVFARFRSPSADAILAAAHFDDAVFLRMERDAPIETVAAEIKQLAAGIPVLVSASSVLAVWYSGWLHVRTVL